ncbi:FG-GAP repeat protein [Nocardiopsis salina]|uniref:FG-GAP repeat protein n=1 Tax=Nocardiopsis salina TaxID=245836 RepID=UPI0012692CC8|nr:FG-GAP repeat protein [Nocardiopsis salina]
MAGPGHAVDGPALADVTGNGLDDLIVTSAHDEDFDRGDLDGDGMLDLAAGVPGENEASTISYKPWSQDTPGREGAGPHGRISTIRPGLTTPPAGNACDHHHPPCPAGQEGGQRT